LNVPDFIKALRTPLANLVALGLSMQRVLVRQVLGEIFYDPKKITEELISVYSGNLSSPEAQKSLAASATQFVSKDLKSVKLLFVGDSITDFWLFDDNPWVSGQKYGRPVWDESFGKPNSDNFGFNIGISGDRIEHVLYRIQPKAGGGLGQLDSPDLSPEFIVTLIGINNTWAAEAPVADSVFEGVRVVLGALHERKPKARIILQTLLPTNDEIKNRDVVRPVNQRLRQLASSPPFSGFISLLDLYPYFVDGSGVQVSGYFTDGLHPNVNGYRVWRDRLVPFLEQARRLPGISKTQ
jgi:lysophospholipase L1-like esterase